MKVYTLTLNNEIVNQLVSIDRFVIDLYFKEYTNFWNEEYKILIFDLTEEEIRNTSNKVGKWKIEDGRLIYE